MSPVSGREDKLPGIIAEIVATYGTVSKINHLADRPLPSRESVTEVLTGLKEILYPGYFGRRHFTQDNITFHIGDRIYQVYRVLAEEIFLSMLHECQRQQAECGHCEALAADTALEFLRRVPALRRLLEEDVEAAYDGRPGGPEPRRDHLLVSGAGGGDGLPDRPRVVGPEGAAPAAHHDRGGPLGHGHRHPPRGDDRPPLLHRPRHGRRHRRDVRDRRPRAACTRA